MTDWVSKAGDALILKYFLFQLNIWWHVHNYDDICYQGKFPLNNKTCISIKANLQTYVKWLPRASKGLFILHRNTIYKLFRQRKKPSV